MLTEYFTLQGKLLHSSPVNGECLVLCEESENLTRTKYQKGKAVSSRQCMFDGNFGNPLFSFKHPKTCPVGKSWEAFLTRTC